MRNSNLKCPASGCEEMSQFRFKLRDHIQLKHEEKLLMEEIKFLSFEALIQVISLLILEWMHGPPSLHQIEQFQYSEFCNYVQFISSISFSF
ncbi:unnamed protein product [Larinioides sclopetarius]|uniref:C2H2-type domain-containing protein n=1 Tax=Larinioides sclopetarius TaxID=280406 RepID=A0AAV1ZIH4_9ARAC